MMYALTERRIFCFGKTAQKLGIIIMAAAVFYNPGMQLGSANEPTALLKGYIQESTMRKEHSNALFLLKGQWMKQVNEKYKGFKIRELQNGVVFVRMTKYVNSRRVNINVTEINRAVNPKLEIIPQMPSNSIHKRSTINKLVSNTGAISAVNGTYFKPNTGTPLGLLMINKEIISGPVYKRAALGIGKDGFKTARISFRGTVSDKEKLVKIDNINQPRMLAANVLLYTPSWGDKAPLTKLPSRYLAVKDGKVIADSNYPLYIPKDGYVINGPRDVLKDFSAGDSIDTEYSMVPKWEDTEHIISGGPYLMKNGEIFIDAAEEKLTSITGRNPRTAIGYTKENILIMVTIEGRKEGSSGVTLSELAKIMRDLGCYEAINLDGGSSTVMYTANGTYNGISSKYPAMINNALVVRMQA